MKPVAFLFPLFPIFIQPEAFSQQPADSAHYMDEVKVTAYQVSSSLRTIPGSISVLTGMDFTQSDNTQLLSILNTIPGVNMQSGTYTTNRIVIRGMGSRTPYNTNRIRFYLDDIPLTSSDGLSSPEEMESENIGRLEIVKGPSSALYGSGLGGSINMYTPVVNETKTTAITRYGSYNTRRLNAGHSFLSKNATVMANVSNLNSRGWRENSRYDRSSVLLAGNIKNIDFLLLLNRVNSELPSSIGRTLFESHPESAAANWKAVGGYKKYVRAVAGIAVNSKISPNVSNKLIVFTKGTDDYEKRPFNNLDDESAGAGIREKVTVHGMKSDWTTGFEWTTEQYRWKLDTNGININRNRENRNQTNIYFVTNFRPLTGFTVSVAGAVNYIRYRLADMYSANGDQSGKRSFPLIFSPRFGLNYSPAPEWAVYLSGSHGFSLPSPEETLLPQGDINRNIKNEKGWQFEFGTRLSLIQNRLTADVVYYRIELRDLLVTKRLSEDIFTGINAGKTRHQGIEVLGRFGVLERSSFPGVLTITGSYFKSVNHFLNFEDNGSDYKGKTLPGIPDHSAVVQLQWVPFKKIEINWDIQNSGKQFLDDANTIDYGSYTLMNARLNIRFHFTGIIRTMIYAGMNNITDAHYASMVIVNALSVNGREPRYYYPGLPRNGYAGLSVTF